MNLKDKCDQVFYESMDNYRYMKDTSIDYWKTPAEFEADGGGDCEDFAIWQREALTTLDVPVSSIWLTQVPYLPHESHIILLVETQGMGKYYGLNILAYEVFECTLADLHEVFGNRTWRRWNDSICKTYKNGKVTSSKPTKIPEWKDMLTRYEYENNNSRK